MHQFMKSLFIAATGQNVGKTTVCLGLVAGLAQRGHNVGYLKPVGQEQVVTADGAHVDKDVGLFRAHFHLSDGEEQMSPVLFPKGFTRDYLDGKIKREKLVADIDRSFAALQKHHSLLVIEGTGHTGVGSIVDLNNAQVAKHLKAPVVLIASGGLGSSFDELELNRVQCEKYGVSVLGVILNRVLEDKRDMIVKYMTKALARWNLPLLGAIPYDAFLSTPSMADFEQLFDAKVIAGKEHKLRHFDQIRLVSTPADLPSHPTQLLIIPGNRDDLIMAVLHRYWALQLSHPDEQLELGMILTGKTAPVQGVVSELKKAPIPVLYTPVSSFVALKMLNTHTSKIRPEDLAKIQEAVRVVSSSVDFELLEQRLK